jgi:hypothetical protein
MMPSIGIMHGPVSMKEYIQKAGAEIGISDQGFKLGGLLPIFSYVPAT